MEVNTEKGKVKLEPVKGPVEILYDASTGEVSARKCAARDIPHTEEPPVDISKLRRLLK